MPLNTPKTIPPSDKLENWWNEFFNLKKMKNNLKPQECVKNVKYWMSSSMIKMLEKYQQWS